MESNITGAAGSLIINNQGTMSGTIGGSTGSGENVATTINNGNQEAESGAEATATITKKITGNAAATTINNYKDGSITGGIDGGAGSLTINNEGEIKQTAITGKAGALTINNSGKIDAGAAITGSTGAATTITNNQSGTINVTIQDASGGGETTLQNDGNITGAITFSHTKSSIINNGRIEAGMLSVTGKDADNQASVTNNEFIEKATINANSILTNNTGATIGTDDSSTLTINGTGSKVTNYGTIKATTELQKSATLENHGTSQGINLKATNMSATEDYNTISNTGDIANITFTGDTSQDATKNIVNITNSGTIGQFTFTKSGTANLANGYAVTLGDKTTYDNSGAISVEVANGETGKIQLGQQGVQGRAGGTNPAIVVNVGNGFNVGEAYDLANFIKNTGTGTMTITDGDKTLTPGSTLTDYLSNNIAVAQNIYDLSFANGAMTIAVEANKSIGALGAIQTIASMNSQITRTQNIVDGVFDSIATGEIGTFSYPREGYLSTPYTGVSKKSKVDEAVQALENEKNPQEKQAKLANVIAKEAQANKSWVGFITPYYSTSSINATGFSATTGSSMGFVGGAAKMLDNGALLGVHVGVDNQTAGKVGSEMQSLGSSFMVGMHTKVPLGQINKSSVTMVPFVKGQVSGMFAINSYRLTPLLDTTREATGLAGGLSASALFGIDMPTNIGYFTPEIGLMQQAVFMPELSFNGFNTSGNDQTINKTVATPLYAIAQLRYTKAIKLSKTTLFPTIKAGVRGAIANADFVSQINVLSSVYYGTNTIDRVVGVVEAGLGAKLGENASVNLSYGGEFGSQITTHNVNVRAAWQF